MALSSSQSSPSRISKTVRDLPASGIRRFFDLIAETDGVISLGVGEPDFVTPWRFREAAIYSLEQGHTMYTSNYGLLELRQAIAVELSRTLGLEYDPRTEILVTVGVSEGLDLAMRTLLEPEDEVLCPEPSYVSYMPCVTLAGGTFVPVPTTAQDNFQVSIPEIRSRVTPKTRALLLGSPNNPTGTVLDGNTLEGLGQLAQEQDLTVISDEIYSRLVYGVNHISIASSPGMQDRTILLGGFSKA